MKVLLVFALFVLAAALAHEKRQFGICVEECSMALTDSSLMSALGVKQCPDGQVCMSNGCGHTCQAASIRSTIPTTVKCPGVFCRMFCANGFQLGSDGCPVCKCA